MQLMAVESMGIQSNGDTEYTYDGNGNLISDNEFCYTYNDANKISIVKTCTDNKLVSEYIYDSAGQRVIKKTFNNGTFDKLAVDVSDLYDLTVKADGTEESNIYYRANNELIAKKDNTGKITYHHNDHLGSASMVTDTHGAIVEETRYYPYGGVREGGSELTGKYTYTGQESDNETGLMYFCIPPEADIEN